MSSCLARAPDLLPVALPTRPLQNDLLCARLLRLERPACVPQYPSCHASAPTGPLVGFWGGTSTNYLGHEAEGLHPPSVPRTLRLQVRPWSRCPCFFQGLSTRETSMQKRRTTTKFEYRVGADPSTVCVKSSTNMSLFSLGNVFICLLLERLTFSTCHLGHLPQHINGIKPLARHGTPTLQAAVRNHGTTP